MSITLRKISSHLILYVGFIFATLPFYSQTKPEAAAIEREDLELPAKIIPIENKRVSDFKDRGFRNKTLYSLAEPKKRLDVNDDADDEIGKNEITLWGGYSPDTTTAFNFGVSPDARFGIAGVRYSRRFNNSDWINLKYTADVVPVAVQNFRAVSVSTGRLLSRRETAYGFGAAPLGIQLNFRPKKKIQPFAGFSAGFIYFNKDIPNSEGKKFNFMLPLDFGVEFRLKNRKAIIAGYKLFHVSNGFRGEQNPGYDHNLIYLGYTFFSK